MIDSKLIELWDDCLKKHCHYIYDYYANPHDENEIELFMSKMSIDSADYKTFYGWKNGLSPNSRNITSPTEIMFHGNFVSLEHALYIFQEHNDKDFFEQSQILIADNFEGERLLLETNPASPNYGMILSLVPFGNHAGEPITIYDNMETMIKSLISMYNLGAVIYDSDTRDLVIDFDKEAEICLPLNPLSVYWVE